MTPIRGGKQVFTSASRSFGTLSEAREYSKVCVSSRDTRVIVKTTSVPTEGDHMVSEFEVVEKVPAVR